MGLMTWRPWSRATESAFPRSRSRSTSQIPARLRKSCSTTTGRRRARPHRRASRVRVLAFRSPGPGRDRAKDRGLGGTAVHFARGIERARPDMPRTGIGNTRRLRPAGRGGGFPPHRLLQFGSREGVVSAVAEGAGLGAIFDDGVLPTLGSSELSIKGRTYPRRSTWSALPSGGPAN